MNASRLQALVAAHARRLKQRYPGVVGVGVSEKTRGGQPTGTLALTIYVREKKPPPALGHEDRADLDGALQGAVDNPLDDIDVKVLKPIKKRASGRVRPVATGCSEGHFAITAGTGGPVAVSQGYGRIRISNNHVYANSNQAALGDAIRQPGPYDGGSANDTVGSLVDFIPLRFNGDPNLVDAAIRSMQSEELAVTVTGGYAPNGTKTPALGMSVLKVGRTTDQTRGIIAAVDLALDVDYGPDGLAYFEDQILVESVGAFSQGGDSGSFVMEDAAGNAGVGLLFAGSDDGTQTICNPIQAVEQALGVTIETGVGEPQPPPEAPMEDRPLIVAILLAVALAIIALLAKTCG